MTAITNSTVVPFSTTATATDRFRIVFQETMHVDDFSLNITLYPNPGKPNQSFYLSGVTDAKVSMQSLLGQEIPVTTHQNGQTMEVKPMTALSAGVYFVRITQEGKTAQVKWIVE
jgi:methionine-rich copper-binding protein CopC